MDSREAARVLVVIAGPQAAGKSTTAAALAADLRGRDESVALVELDQIAAMALPTLPGWDVAHEIFESIVGRWARGGVTCVIAEGSGFEDEAGRVRAQAPASTAVVTVAITVPFPIAFARARADGSRGVSRQYDFLHAVYERWPDDLAAMRADVVVDTHQHSLDEGVALIRAAIERAR